jgi:hypothetical protein
MLYAQSERYRRLSLADPSVMVKRDVTAEHRAIADAVLAHDST